MSWFEHGTTCSYYEEQVAGAPLLFLPGYAQRFAELSAHAAAYRAPGTGKHCCQPPAPGENIPKEGKTWT
jgi:hypothetical protein